MFLYKGSKLENDIEKLTKEVSTPEYEKIIRPYKEEIRALNQKIYNMKEDLESLYCASTNLIRSMEKDWIEIIINNDEPRAYFVSSINAPLQREEVRYTKVAIPVKRDLIEDFLKNMEYYKENYNLKEDK